MFMLCRVLLVGILNFGFVFLQRKASAAEPSNDLRKMPVLQVESVKVLTCNVGFCSALLILHNMLLQPKG